MNAAATLLACALTLVGGPTVLIEIGEVRLLTDPTFDSAGSTYVQGPVKMERLASPSLSPEALGEVDAVLLSHDEHRDNLDDKGRAYLPKARTVLTTPKGARRLGGNARGLRPWEMFEVVGRKGTRVRVTAVPARHGPKESERFIGEVTGFVLQWGTPERTLYVTGDTVWFDGLTEIGARFRVDAAVVFGGAARFEGTGPMRFTLDAEETLKLVRTLQIPLVIPAHIDGWAHLREDREDLAASFAAAGLASRLLPVKPGQRVPLAICR